MPSSNSQSLVWPTMRLVICEEKELQCVSSWLLAKARVAAEAHISPKATVVITIITAAVAVIAMEVVIQTAVGLLKAVIITIVRPARHLKNKMGEEHKKVTAASAAERKVTGPVLVL